MQSEDFTSSRAGIIKKTLQGYHAFFPKPLPPVLELDWPLARLLSEAERVLAELSWVGQLLPNSHLFIRPYLFREAISSSRIENTFAEMEELFRFEVEEEAAQKRADVLEVWNYAKAHAHGLHALSELPLSKRLICEMHRILLSNVRGGHISKTPGEFRRSQNWIGKPGSTLDTATFVPPPPDEMLEALSDWERYIYVESVEPILVKCAILHYQFEAIHPFQDGNGRLGRAIISLFLCEQNLLSQPVLHLSAFFDENRDAYYESLLRVSQKGDWRQWIEFFLLGVRQQARSALKDTQAALQLYKKYQTQLKGATRVPRTAAQILDELFANPFFSIPRYAKKSGESFANINLGVKFWIKRGVLMQGTERNRNRVFIARELLVLLYLNN